MKYLREKYAVYKVVRRGLPGKMMSDLRLERHKGGSCRNTGEEICQWKWEGSGGVEGEEGTEIGDSLKETMGPDL